MIEKEVIKALPIEEEQQKEPTIKELQIENEQRRLRIVKKLKASLPSMLRLKSLVNLRDIIRKRNNTPKNEIKDPPFELKRLYFAYRNSA